MAMIAEAKGVYVMRNDRQQTLTVYRPSKSQTHAVSDCTFADTPDGLSLAMARLKYLTRS